LSGLKLGFKRYKAQSIRLKGIVGPENTGKESKDE
jgi:hypothetical protein